MTTKTLDLNNIERKLFWVISGFLGLGIAVYFYSVATLTMSVAARDQAISASRALASEASTLEFEYLAIQNKMTLSYAQEKYGLKEVAVKFTDNNEGNKLSFSR